MALECTQNGKTKKYCALFPFQFWQKKILKQQSTEVTLIKREKIWKIMIRYNNDKWLDKLMREQKFFMWLEVQKDHLILIHLFLITGKFIWFLIDSEICPESWGGISIFAIWKTVFVSVKMFLVCLND